MCIQWWQCWCWLPRDTKRRWWCFFYVIRLLNPPMRKLDWSLKSLMRKMRPNNFYPDWKSFNHPTINKILWFLFTYNDDFQIDPRYSVIIIFLDGKWFNSMKDLKAFRVFVTHRILYITSTFHVCRPTEKTNTLMYTYSVISTSITLVRRRMDMLTWCCVRTRDAAWESNQ